jgi:hypothetical protein
VLVLRKRLLLATLLIISISIAISLSYFNKSSINSPSSTSFSKVDFSSLLASGQNEGEQVNFEQHYEGAIRGIPVPSFRRYSLVEGLNQTYERLGVILVPTTLPEGITYSDVYIGPTVDLCFSYNRTDDPSRADIVIEIGSVSVVPSVDYLKSHLLQGSQLIQAGDQWVTMHDDYVHNSDGQSWAFGHFFHNNLQYLVNARYPLTNQDLVTIIRNMRTTV